MKSTRLARLLIVGTCGVAGCLTIDPFFFNGSPVDGYDWDADPADPDLEGEDTPLHPSKVPAAARIEALLDVDGRAVHYVYAHRPGAAATVFFSHGNTLHLGHYWERVEWLWERGFNVMVYDYPGYGLSTGDPDEASVFANAAAALEVLPTLADFTPERVVFYGYSLGGAPTYEMALRGVEGEGLRPDAVVTESTFCSTDAMVEDGSFIGLSGSFLSHNPFDNCAKIGRLGDLPILILHGGADSFVVPRHAHLLDEAAEGRATLEIIPGAEHSTVPVVGGDAYWATMVDFLTGP
ncbi:MAG: alpha/beta hydrolase [Nannocystaceae bacterium]